VAQWGGGVSAAGKESRFDRKGVLGEVTRGPEKRGAGRRKLWADGRNKSQTFAMKKWGR